MTAEEESVPLSKSEHRLLSFLRKRAESEYVYRVDLKQAELAETLGISRQALSVKLRPLIEKNLIRTGRGFIEITEDGLATLGQFSRPVFILVKVEPTKRKDVYAKMEAAAIGKVNKVAGDVDLIIQVDGGSAAEVLDFISGLDGVISTMTYFTLESTG
jgi:DNA-binding Lrp family transcriptional regulator